MMNDLWFYESIVAGIVSIVSDIASSKLTVTGDLNPVAIIKQLKKNKCSPHLEELGPVKDEKAEAKKKKEEEEKKKKEEEEKKRKEEEEEEKKRMIWNQACNRPMIFEVMCENPSYWWSK